MSAKRRPEHHEEHIDESWLIPYADILTLLLALFIVLFASAQVDQKKFEQLAQSFSNAFNGNTSVLDNVRTVSQSADAPPRQETLPTSVTALTGDKEKAFQAEMAQLAEAKRTFDSYIQGNQLNGTLETALTEDGLLIRIKDTALFSSGQAELLPESQDLANQIAALLGTMGQPVVISGHTDNVPINTAEFPTNWDLSSKRALNFMKYLLGQNPKLQPARFSAIGNGEYRPIASNEDAAGRAKNRRVEVLIVRKHNL